MRLFLKIVKWTTFTLLVSFIAINILWQYQYEQVIGDARKQCIALHARPRIKHTPVIVVMWDMYRNRKEIKMNDWSSRAMFGDCVQLFPTGYCRCYVAHCFLTNQQKDSIVDANNLRNMLEHEYN